ncbi:MAG TPA: hypothetical protein VKT75_06945 [Acidobacteriaceae bacterium]|nr:hypothetical protein [Acidobacteriaceae bacterium]
MWRISALLWSIVEWCEERVARRRILYCLEQQRHVRGSSVADRFFAAFNSRMRGTLAFVFLLLAGRR